jgi:hypothetical protein
MTDETPDVGLTGYDDSSSAGYICKECGALVPRMPSFATRHTNWHRQLVDIVTKSQQNERELKGLGRHGG